MSADPFESWAMVHTKSVSELVIDNIPGFFRSIEVIKGMNIQPYKVSDLFLYRTISYTYEQNLLARAKAFGHTP